MNYYQIGRMNTDTFTEDQVKEILTEVERRSDNTQYSSLIIADLFWRLTKEQRARWKEAYKYDFYSSVIFIDLVLYYTDEEMDQISGHFSRDMLNQLRHYYKDTD